MTSANLIVGAITTASSTTVPAGSVISQAPIAGTQVVTGSAVALVVSSGLPQVAVPAVVGLTQSAATAAITSANLIVGAVTTASSTTVPAGSVISETPIAGTQVVTGSAVALVVSSGPPQVAVPSVVGLTQAADHYAQAVSDELLSRVHGETEPHELLGRLATVSSRHLREVTALPTDVVKHFNSELTKETKPRQRQTAHRQLT